MSNTHTDGPWELHTGPEGAVISAHGVTIAIIPKDSPTWRANARILRAAFGMSEALETIEARIMGVFDHPLLEAYGPLGRTNEDVLGITQAAIGETRHE